MVVSLALVSSRWENGGGIISIIFYFPEVLSLHDNYGVVISFTF